MARLSIKAIKTYYVYTCMYPHRRSIEWLDLERPQHRFRAKPSPLFCLVPSLVDLIRTYYSSETEVHRHAIGFGRLLPL